MPRLSNGGGRAGGRAAGPAHRLLSPCRTAPAWRKARPCSSCASAGADAGRPRPCAPACRSARAQLAQSRKALLDPVVMVPWAAGGRAPSCSRWHFSPRRVGCSSSITLYCSSSSFFRPWAAARRAWRGKSWYSAADWKAAAVTHLGHAVVRRHGIGLRASSSLAFFGLELAGRGSDELDLAVGLRRGKCNEGQRRLGRRGAGAWGASVGASLVGLEDLAHQGQLTRGVAFSPASRGRAVAASSAVSSGWGRPEGMLVGLGELGAGGGRVGTGLLRAAAGACQARRGLHQVGLRGPRGAPFRRSLSPALPRCERGRGESRPRPAARAWGSRCGSLPAPWRQDQS